MTAQHREIGDPGHFPSQRVDLAHQLPLADAADGRVAGHLRDRVQVLREQQRPRAHARGREGGFAAGVAAAYHRHVEYFRVIEGGHMSRSAWNISGLRKPAEESENKKAALASMAATRAAAARAPLVSKNAGADLAM